MSQLKVLLTERNTIISKVINSAGRVLERYIKLIDPAK